jgi:pentose-5-phosphate-3-epimerase
MDVHAMIEANDAAGLKAVVAQGSCIAITAETSATVTRSMSSYILSSHRVESNGIALWFRTRDMKCCWKYVD